MVIKVFFKIEIFYLAYSLLFLFDNAINYLIYVNNMFFIIQINKKSDRKQI